MLKDFKAFISKGNVIDLAVAVVIGAAFGAVVKSFVDDLLSPIIGLLGKHDFSNLFFVMKDDAGTGPYASLADAHKAGAVVFAYGSFLTTLINFIIIGFAIFLVVKAVEKTKKPEAAPAPAGPTPEVQLLTEIRDSLKK